MGRAKHKKLTRREKERVISKYIWADRHRRHIPVDLEVNKTERPILKLGVEKIVGEGTPKECIEKALLYELTEYLINNKPYEVIAFRDQYSIKCGMRIDIVAPVKSGWRTDEHDPFRHVDISGNEVW